MKDNRLITVITVSRRRVPLLKRAIDSVKRQSMKSVNQIIVVDDCLETFNFLRENYYEDKEVRVIFVSRGEEKPGPERLSVLRNLAICWTDSEYIAFLDDDNEYLPNHLRDLYLFSKKEDCDAVHSYRRLFYNNGEPYLEKMSPWGSEKETRANKYQYLLKKGVVREGSNIWREQYGITIDTNVWLIKSSLLKTHLFPTEYDREDYKNRIGEDKKLMNLFLMNNIQVKTNKEPSVKYYLGGYSNRIGNTKGSVDW